MSAYMRDERELDTTASRSFTRLFLVAVLTAVGIGFGLGIIWIAAGLLHFHPLW